MKKMIIIFVSLLTASILTIGLTIGASNAAVKLSKPKNIKISELGKTSVKLTWDKVKNAEKYKITYSGKTVTVKKPSKKIKGLKSGKEYIFKIVAYKGKAKSDPASKKVTTKAKESITEVPTPVKVVSNKGKLKVNLLRTSERDVYSEPNYPMQLVVTDRKSGKSVKKILDIKNAGKNISLKSKVGNTYDIKARYVTYKTAKVNGKQVKRVLDSSPYSKIVTVTVTRSDLKFAKNYPKYKSNILSVRFKKLSGASYYVIKAENEDQKIILNKKVYAKDVAKSYVSKKYKNVKKLANVRVTAYNSSNNRLSTTFYEFVDNGTKWQLVN